MSRLLATALLLLLAACTAPMAGHSPRAPVTVGIIAINDFHGALEPPNAAVLAPDDSGGSVAVPAGGAAWLASAIDTVRGKYGNSAIVSAGDLISASPLASSIYLDEPAVEVMNRIGLDFNAVGNHEFDRGRAELLRMQRGGCEKHTQREPCQLERFGGARFTFLSASTVTEDGATLFPATGIKRFGSGADAVTVGFIGVTLKSTPQLVSPDGVAGLTFGDEADAINAAVPQLRQQGADAIVVLIHQGGFVDGDPDPDGCPGLTGDILPILARLDPRVDVVVSGHTHNAYVCDYGEIDPARPILLTSAALQGRLVTDITLTIDPDSDRVVAKSARNVIVQSREYVSRDGPVRETGHYPRFMPRADIAAYVARYVDGARTFAERAVGKVSAGAPRLTDGTGGALGELIADAHLAATRDAGAQIAFTNPYGVRAALDPTADGSVTFGQIYAIQPFGNQLVTQTLTGAQIASLLEQGLGENGAGQVLSPSQGFAYTVERGRPAGQRVAAMKLNGVPLSADESYRVTVNGFLASGGDGFSVLKTGRGRVTGPVDIDALESWIAAVPVREMPSAMRVTFR